MGAPLDAAYDTANAAAVGAVNSTAYDDAATAVRHVAFGAGGWSAGTSSSSADLADMAATIGALGSAATDAERIDQIRALEDLKCACAAAQARITADFAASRRARALRDVDDEMRAVPGGGGPTAQKERLSRGRQRAEIRRKALRLAARSAAAEVALARRESPTRGGEFVGLAEILVHEMPCMLAALGAGVINERRARVIARETATLSRDQRGLVDREIADQIDGLGDGRLAALVAGIAYRMEPEAAVARSTRAARDRRVTLRPAPDTMAYLTLLLPLPTAVACYATLQSAAESHPGGDGRTVAQRMADTAVERIAIAGNISDQQAPPASEIRDAEAGLGPVDAEANAATNATPMHSETTTAHPDSTQASHESTVAQSSTDTTAADPTAADPSAANPTVTDPAAADPSAAVRASYAAACIPRISGSSGTTAPPGAPGQDPGAVTATSLPPGAGIVVNLVISDRALFGADDTPAYLPGNLPMPAPLARAMIAGLPADAKVWIRRLYARPGTGQLLAADSRRRAFPPALREVLMVRDRGVCRVPWCDARACHADHLQPHAAGGPTSLTNGQALSADCNYARTASGWAARRDSSGTIMVTTPTGHRYASREPGLPVPRPATAAARRSG